MNDRGSDDRRPAWDRIGLPGWPNLCVLVSREADRVSLGMSRGDYCAMLTYRAAQRLSAELQGVAGVLLQLRDWAGGVEERVRALEVARSSRARRDRQRRSGLVLPPRLRTT